MSRKYAQAFYDISGGMNTSDADINIKDNECVLAQNVILDAGLMAKKRSGITNYGYNLPSNPVQMFKLYSDPAPAFIVVLKDGSIYFISNGSCSGNLVVGAGILGNNLITAQMCDYISNGVKGCYCFGGQTKAFRVSTSSAWLNSQSFFPTVGTAFKRRLFCDSTTDLGRLYFSDMDDDSTWNDYIDLEVGNDDQIVKVIELNGYLYVFCKYSLHYVYGRSTLSFGTRLLNSTIGTLSPNSICTWRSTLFFVGSDKKVYAWDGVSTPRDISAKINEEIDDISSSDLANVSGVIVDEQYRVSYRSPNATNASNDKTLVFHLTLRDSSIPAVSVFDYGYDNLAAWNTSQDSGEIFGSYKTDTIVDQLDLGDTDKGNAITARIKSKKLYFENPFQNKRVTRYWLHAFGSSTDYAVKIDADAGAKTSGYITTTLGSSTNALKWGTGHWGEKKWAGSALSIAEQTVPQGIEGKTIEWEIQEAGTQSDIDVYGITLEFDKEQP